MDSKLSHHILKVLSEFEANLADTIVRKFLQELTSADLPERRDELLTDEQLCNHLQISTAHFYKLKKKHKSIFPVYDLGGSKRYKQSEVEGFFKSLKTKQHEKK